eukprot:TRINITY_DN6464_c2_g1_i2.p1 TRINITY_DN6464_c2_g1~~TRINITY_DN6464_c2_g1_i2.p1  ORF type:complete len:522 (-),score=102.22 TRINITY_DN6464_c2_g1_i2:950-2515(-)
MVEKEGAGDTLAQFKSFLEQGKTKEAKLLLRNQPTRDFTGTWKAIISHHSRGRPVDTSSIYWDTVDTCFGGTDLADCRDKTPTCVESNHLPNYDLDTDRQAEICRLVTCLAYNSPDITYSPLLYPCAAILRRHLSEEECYAALSILVEPPRGSQFLTQSRRSWEIMCQTLYPLAQKFIKKHVSKLEAIVEKDQLQATFTSWPWWIFECTPVQHLQTMFTSFFMEGNKVLYRFALALTKHYAKQSFYLSAAREEGFQKSMRKCVSSLQVDVLQMGFKIARFSRSEIAKMSIKVDMELKSLSNLEDGKSLERRRSNLELIAPDAAQDILAVSDTLSYKQLQKLWHLLPERITMVKPKLVFSSNDHGTSLRTFYNKCEYYEPTLLFVRTKDGDIFGAYCSSTWRERNEKDERGLRQLYFGTGETFLFKLLRGQDGQQDEIQAYKWVGRDKEIEGKGDRAEQLFMSGDDTMISIGGGEGTGLYVNENLEFGRTETCKTFQNPPLASNSDFTISVVEVIGFNDTKW